MTSPSTTAPTSFLEPTQNAPVRNKAGRPTLYEKDSNGRHILDANGNRILKPGRTKPTYKERGSGTKAQVGHSGGSQASKPKRSNVKSGTRRGASSDLAASIRAGFESLKPSKEQYQAHSQAFRSGALEDSTSRLREVNREQIKAVGDGISNRKVWEMVSSKEKRRRGQGTTKAKRSRRVVYDEEESEYEEEDLVKQPVRKRVRRPAKRVVQQIIDDDDEEEEEEEAEEVEAVIGFGDGNLGAVVEQEEEPDSEEDFLPNPSRPQVPNNGPGHTVLDKFIEGAKTFRGRLRGSLWTEADEAANPSPPLNPIVPVLRGKNFKKYREDVREKDWNRMCDIMGLNRETDDPRIYQPPTKQWSEWCTRLKVDLQTGRSLSEEEQFVIVGMEGMEELLENPIEEEVREEEAVEENWEEEAPAPSYFDEAFDIFTSNLEREAMQESDPFLPTFEPVFSRTQEPNTPFLGGILSSAQEHFLGVLENSEAHIAAFLQDTNAHIEPGMLRPTVLLKDLPLPGLQDISTLAIAVLHCKATGQLLPNTLEGIEIAVETSRLNGTVPLAALDENSFPPGSNMYLAIRYSKEGTIKGPRRSSLWTWCEQDVKAAAGLMLENDLVFCGSVERPMPRQSEEATVKNEGGQKEVLTCKLSMEDIGHG